METQPRRSLESIWSAVLSLSDAQLLALKRYSQWRVRMIGRKAWGRGVEDLLHEAITTTASGDRVWKEGVDFSTHLFGAMRSISSRWRGRRDEGYLESDLPHGESEQGALNVAATTIDPERVLRAKERLEQIYRLFEQDELAARLIQLLGEKYTAREIQSQLGITQKEFAAAVKRIKRKLELEL